MSDRRESVQKVLTKINPTLRRHLNLNDDLFVALKATEPEVISDEEHQEINAISVHNKMIDHLLAIMKRKSADVYFQFMAVLEEKDHDLYIKVMAIRNEYFPHHIAGSLENNGACSGYPGASSVHETIKSKPKPVAAPRSLAYAGVEPFKNPEFWGTVRTPERSYPKPVAAANASRTADVGVVSNKAIERAKPVPAARRLGSDEPKNAGAPVPIAASELGFVEVEEPDDLENEITMTPKTDEAAPSCCVVRYTHSTPSHSPDVEIFTQGNKWIQIDQFSTKPGLNCPQGIAIHPSGDVAVTNVGLFAPFYGNRALKFSRDRHILAYTTFRGPFYTRLPDVAITQDMYIFPGLNKLLFYDCQGTHLKSLDTTINTDTTMTNIILGGGDYPTTIAVDSEGRIIAGMRHMHGSNTICIHDRDRRFISKFDTQGFPLSLAVTHKGDLAVISRVVFSLHVNDKTLQVMDYSGNNIREVQRPPGVGEWDPEHVCCSQQGEIFVVNSCDDSVYRYTADGDKCLGRIISDVDKPKGIAITEDGQQLYVVEQGKAMVKIFQRP